MKNHHQRNFGSSLSENFSGDVIHSILSNPTDTLQALNESDLSAKIWNTTQSAKNKLKKFFNGDFSINYNGTFAQIRQGLRKLLSALQFNLQLPDGLTANTGNATLGSATDSHTLFIETLDNGDLLFILYSMDLKTFSDGKLLRIPVTAGNSATTTAGQLYSICTPLSAERMPWATRA